MKDCPLQNIKLGDLANKFDNALDKVKELQLHHLVEPIQSAAVKLHQLDEIAKELSCDYYDDYPCANNICCNEVELNKISKEPLLSSPPTTSAEKGRVHTIESDKSCECFDIQGVKSCNCGSDYNNEDSALCRTLISGDRKIDSSRVENEKKCAKCKCTLSTSGRKTKTLDLKLDTRGKKCNNGMGDEFAADVDQSSGPGRPIDDDIILERIISNKRIEIDTNFRNLNLYVNKENTVIQDTAYTKVQERNQAILCNLSSESSSAEYMSDHSSDEEYYSRGITSNPPFAIGRNLNICGCGKLLEDAAAAVVVGSEICPCGCGDMMDMPKEKFIQRKKMNVRPGCRCENCGKEITENQSTMDTKTTVAETKKTESFSDFNPTKDLQAQNEKIRSRKEDLRRDNSCVIPFEDVKTYIDDLEVQCREKDEMIMELTKLIESCKGPGSESDVSEYSTLYKMIGSTFLIVTVLLCVLSQSSA